MTEPWGDEHRKRVRGYYSMFIGTLCVFLGGILLVWDKKHSNPSTTMELVVSGGIVLLGLVAAMPQTFMPIISKLIERIPGGPNVEPRADLEEIVERMLRETQEKVDDSNEA